MNIDPAAANTHEKARLRAEIEAQVREYLRRGGEIDVLHTRQRAESNIIGGVWHSQLEEPLSGF